LWVLSVDIVSLSKNVSGVLEESLEPFIDEMLAFAVVASTRISDRMDLLEHSIGILDTIILPAVKDSLQSVALNHMNGGLISLFDLIDCVGGNNLAESLTWAVDVLTGKNTFIRPEGIEAISICMEWDDVLLEAADDIVASAVIYGYVSSVNKLLVDLVTEGV
jgi:hypothetical protein